MKCWWVFLSVCVCKTYGRWTSPDRSCRQSASPELWRDLWTGRPCSTPWGAFCSGEHTQRCHFNPWWSVFDISCQLHLVSIKFSFYLDVDVQPSSRQDVSDLGAGRVLHSLQTHNISGLVYLLHVTLGLHFTVSILGCTINWNMILNQASTRSLPCLILHLIWQVCIISCDKLHRTRRRKWRRTQLLVKWKVEDDAPQISTTTLKVTRKISAENPQMFLCCATCSDLFTKQEQSESADCSWEQGLDKASCFGSQAPSG